LFTENRLENITIKESTVQCFNSFGPLFGTEEQNGLINLKRRVFDRQNQLFDDQSQYNPGSSTDAVALYMFLSVLKSSPLQVYEGRGAAQFEVTQKVIGGMFDEQPPQNADDFFGELFFNCVTGSNLGKEIEVPIGFESIDYLSLILGSRPIILRSEEGMRTKALEDKTRDIQGQGQ
jgi:hypothetical protein